MRGGFFFPSSLGRRGGCGVTALKARVSFPILPPTEGGGGGARPGLDPRAQPCVCVLKWTISYSSPSFQFWRLPWRGGGRARRRKKEGRGRNICAQSCMSLQGLEGGEGRRASGCSSSHDHLKKSITRDQIRAIFKRPGPIGTPRCVRKATGAAPSQDAFYAPNYGL